MNRWVTEERCGSSASRALIPWDFGSGGGAALTLKLRKVSCDLLHIKAVRRVRCCNDFKIHPHWEHLNKFQELPSWYWTDLKWTHRWINAVDQLSPLWSTPSYLAAKSEGGMFPSPHSARAPACRAPWRRPAWRYDIMKMKWLSLQAHRSSPGQMSLLLCALIMLHHVSRWYLAPRRSGRPP